MIKTNVRLVQLSGKGSLMVSLPKDYCNENGITGGTVIKFTEEPAGLLLSKVI